MTEHYGRSGAEEGCGRFIVIGALIVAIVVVAAIGRLMGWW